MSEFFETRLSEWKEQIDGGLKAIIAGLNYCDDFKKVLEYALFPGGKRLRPILMLEFHNLFELPDEYALNYACGIEILHTYSLIHDDMPCMDNDDMRRGKPTVHKMFGEAKALLAGDALLDLAYRILNAPMPNGGVGPFCGFSSLGGDNGLINGQYIDLFGDIASVDELLDMYKQKTGALIKLACNGGYVLGNRRKIRLECDGISGKCNIINEDRSNDRHIINGMLTESFAQAFGQAFQLYDDISEYISGEKQGERSILKFLDLDDAKKLLNEKLNNSAKALDTIGGDNRFLHEFIEKFVIV